VLVTGEAVQPAAMQYLPDNGALSCRRNGLAVWKEAAERDGERIWMESEQGKSTTFLFNLPASE
jgi:signal transduction histidine kinase